METVVNPKIVVRDLWKIFGRWPDDVLASIRAEDSTTAVLDRTGHVVAVRGVSFAVQPGETFVVMGLSGSGKSTLVRSIARLHESTRGQVLLDGEDILKMGERQLLQVRRQKISMVFQHFGLLPHRRVIDNVGYGLEVQGVDRRKREERAAAMIELVGLRGWEYAFPRQLSGGMQQRVGLARALAGDPDVLLFDEPFSALDPLIRREMQEELLRLQRTLHKTSIFITHDFAEALRLGDRVAIMRAGSFVQVGAPSDLVLNPKDDYVRAFVRDAPRARVLTAASIAQPPPIGQGLYQLPSTAPDTLLEDVLPLVAAHDSPIVVRQADGPALGIIDRVGVLRALINQG